MTDSVDHAEVFQRFLRETAENSVDERLATSHWRQRCLQIQEDARTGNPMDFLRWPSLGDFSIPESWLSPVCYETLRRSEAWETRWFGLTRDSKVGSPKDFSRDYGTSPILVGHAFHLLRYEEATGHSLLDCDVIFEIGAGYGSFCRLLKNAGFSGLHILYDLPHVSSIQRLYLTLLGFTEVRNQQLSKRHEHGFSLITDDDLAAAFDFLSSSGLRVGFVATWSLSEAPLAVREKLFPRLHDFCQRYLIAFQPYWETIDNAAYFGEFLTARPDLNWRREEVPPSKSYYLFA